jgi:hypothetical protein
VDEEQGRWVGADAQPVYEVELDPLDRHSELVERVQLRLLRPPVKAFSPALGQAAHELEA